VNGKLNAVPNKYDAKEEVGSRLGEHLFAQPEDGEEYDTRHIGNAFNERRQEGDGTTEHSNERCDQHQKKQRERGGEQEDKR
jgi:hypothetical protein